MSEFKSSNFKNEDGSNGPDLVGVTTFTSPHYFVPPSGTTAQRPSGDGLAPGMLRFNTDIGRLEVWRGDHWATILGESPSLNGGTRGVFGGGATPTPAFARLYNLDYVTISTTGNALDFGDLIAEPYRITALSSDTRGIFGGSYAGTMSYITFSTTGNAKIFGDLSVGHNSTDALASKTRGMFISGYDPSLSPVSHHNTIEYITIASTGNGQDFGDLRSPRRGVRASSSSTRGVIGGGYDYDVSTRVNTIDYVTISSTGNSQYFGDLTNTKEEGGRASNSIRSIWANGSDSGNIIEYVTISTLGNAQDFGDLFSVNAATGFSSSTRALFTASNNNTIQYITIMTTGNSTDFGDMTNTKFQYSGCSNGHGGL